MHVQLETHVLRGNIDESGTGDLETLGPLELSSRGQSYLRTLQQKKLYSYITPAAGDADWRGTRTYKVQVPPREERQTQQAALRHMQAPTS
jgi:hypothetical protein